MQITKKEIIEKLYEIEQKEGVKVDKAVQQVIRNEIVPMDTIKLINKYDKEFLQIYDTFNEIYKARNKNPLYKNLRRTDINMDELAIALSSFITKILISCSKIDNIQDRVIYVTAMNLEKISKAINMYSIYNETKDLIECSKEIRELFALLYDE